MPLGGHFLLPSLLLKYVIQQFFPLLKFSEDLIGSVVHVLSYRNKLKGWKPAKTPGSTAGVKALAVQLVSELKPSGELRKIHVCFSLRPRPGAKLKRR